VLSRALADSGSGLATELLDFMHTYWLSYDGDDEHLWSHEWNKHGTCISTLEPDCYSPDDDDGLHRHQRHLDVLDYFIHTTSLFRTLDTYSTLAEAGILPSSTKRYTLRDLEDALSSSPHAQPVTFRCNHRGELNEIWYHFSVMGSLRHSSYAHTAGSLPSDETAGSPFLNASTVHRHFVPAPPDGILSNCPRRGIKYLPKHAPSQSPTGTHSTSPPEPTVPSAPFTGKGHLEIHVLDTTERKGCLIRHGEWYTSGQCATYRSKRDVVDPGHAPLFSLSSSYSPCLVNPVTSKFECTRQASVQGIFSSSADDEKVLAYRNSSVFWAERVPGRFEKVDVFADNGAGQREVQVEIHWVPV
jgi:ribonuclease T2